MQKSKIFLHTDNNNQKKKKKKMGFTPCKAEQSLKGMELEEKET